MTSTTKPETFAIGQRVRRHFDGELGTVSETFTDGQIADVDMDTPHPERDKRADLERWTPVREPYVGMGCSITYVTDTRPAVVVKVNKKSVTVRAVELTGKREQDMRVDGAGDPNCPPVIVEQGDPTKPFGEPQRFERIGEGRYKGLVLGTCVRRTDYRM